MRFCLGPLVFYLATVGNLAFATPESRSGVWVCKQVDLFVAAAHAAYQRPEAIPAYKKLLAEIVRTIEQHRLSGDEEFFGRYRQFVDYIEAASLDLKPDHKLGFNVTDKQYFEETQPYVQIPPFLQNQKFLRWASRSETVPRAKAFLKLLNSTRAPSDQLIFFSYRSRHLGTPENNNSYRRLLIVVPGDASQRIPEKWVQFGVTDPGKKACLFATSQSCQRCLIQMEHSTLILRIISAHIAAARRSKSKGAGNWDKAATIAPNAIRAASFRFFRSKAA